MRCRRSELALPTFGHSKWSVKKPALLQHSLLPINQQFHAAIAWDEAAIGARSDDLLKRALTIWPRG